MRLAPSLILPDELERARSGGSLVVFAGAGVSMGHPANLPNFRDLAREIADPPVPLRPEDLSNLDRYLGRAERLAQVRVQERAREKLLARGGSHTPLHEYLVGLFSTPDAVRLVTTNFDTHFTTAATAVFADAPIRHAIGPALPLGRDFRGVAQLHGSLRSDADRLVLTMSDFAEAYMTEGWATRFLTGLFRDRAVLFIGYSLTDPVMQYLLSALPPTGAWYAVCHQDEQQRWIEQPIKTVTFADRADGNRYGDLYDGLQRWYWYARATPTDHDARLRRIVESGPPSDPDESDYLLTRLETEAGRVTFWTAAKEATWLTWASQAGFLDPIFDPKSVHPNVGQWSWWCIDNFCGTATPPLLNIIRRRSLKLHLIFTRTLAHSLFRATALPPPEVLRQLVAIIVSQPPEGGNEVTEWLLGKLVEHGHHAEAMAVLRHATTLTLERIEFLDFFVDDSTPGPELPALASRVALNVDADDLDRFLDHHGETLARAAPTSLVALGQRRLVEAYELLGFARGSSGAFDTLSFGRTAIAPTNQDAYPHAEDVLVTITRLGLDAWIQDGCRDLFRFVDEHAADDRRLLKRLAIYAFTDAPLSADEVLAAAIERRWAQDFWVRPELYRLLKARYASASEDARARLIVSLRDPTTWDDPEGKDDSHARFSLSVLLAELAPGSPAALEFASNEKSAHPEWKRQDEDGYLSRVEVGWGGDDIPSPITAEQLRQLAPNEALDKVAKEWEAEDSPRRSLVAALQQACRDDPSWAAALLHLTLREQALSFLVEAAFWGLRDAQADSAVQADILNAALTYGWPAEALSGFSMLIEHWSRGLSKDPGVPTRLLELLERAADEVFAQSSGTASGLTEGSWHDRAFNHPAGRAARVWWITADVQDRDGDSFVVSVDTNERSRWERALLDGTAAGEHARPILGSASDRLAIGDFDWASRNLFPAFDPEKDPVRAAQLWDGRLAHRHWSWSTVAGLRPVLRSFLTHSATLLPDRSDDIGDWIAFLVGNRKESGFSLADLQHFVQHGSDRARIAFARAMPRHVGHLDAPGRGELWNDVLGPYWKDRRTNVPAPFSSGEVAEMIEWVLALPEVAKLAANELKQTQAEALPHLDGLIWKWRQDKTWMEAHPNEAATILRWLSESASIPIWVADDAVQHLAFLADHGASQSDILASAEALAAQSVSSAAALARQLRDSKS